MHVHLVLEGLHVCLCECAKLRISPLYTVVIVDLGLGSHVMTQLCFSAY